MSDLIEEWRWIKGYEDRYMVSNLGRIKSFLKNCDGHILSLKNRTGDYLRVRLSDKTKNKQTKGVHVLVAGTFIQEIPNGWEVHHIDGDKQNNAASNLEIVSPQNHKYETRKMHPNIANGLVEYNKHIKPKAIQQYTADGVFLASFLNQSEFFCVHTRF